jgi:fatty-acyl-CoA synthase
LDLPDAPDLSAVVLFGGTSPGGFIAEDDFDSIGSKHTDDEVHTLRHRIAVRHDALIFYTSGTTAMPKGCPLSHEAAVRTGIQTARRARWQRDERLWVPLPMFHTGFTQPLTAMMHVGGTIVTQGHFDAAEALDLIDRERVTAMFPAFPLITQSLLTHPSYSAETFRAVRTCFNVAPPEMLRSMQAKMPHTVQISGFGMTEFGGSIAMNDPSDPLDSRISNQGMPFEGVEIEIRDEENQPVSLNQRGEIVVRSPTLFSGYLNAPDDNTIEADGWFHTGDLGMLDFKGRLSYLGRLKDMLKVGGENVAAIEIESHIASHPSVINVAVVGVADAKYLEVPAAFVELRPGSDTTAEDVIAHCTGAMASFKVPRHVRFIAEWPMSATKVQKFRLREMFEAGEI